MITDAGVTTVELRYPTGWGGAAAIRVASGKILTSVAPDTNNDALSLCMEVGGCLEAHKLNECVTHSICVFRDNESQPFKILSPCGICSERLAYWGGDVTTRQYARIIDDWIYDVGLDSGLYGTHSLRRTKPTLIYKRTRNLRAVQLLPGYTKLESTVRYLGVEVDDA